MARHTKTLARSFAGGEMSPEMFSRLDDAVFQSGAATLLNCIAQPTGSVTRRSGTRLLKETRDPTKVAHLFSFVFSPTQSAIIEASRATIGGVEGGYFRFHSNGGTLLYPKPDRYRHALNTSGSGSTWIPTYTVSVALGSPMVVTLANHGLQNGDQASFISGARTVPDADNTANADRPLPGVFYYVRDVTTHTFTLSTSLAGSQRVAATQHVGVNPVMFHWTRWIGRAEAMQGALIPEHRIANKSRVAITMWPDTLCPTVQFGAQHFRLTQAPNGYPVQVAATPVCAQQVVFVASDFGGSLPSNIEEGRLYWAVSYDSALGWRISKTFGGPPIDMGKGARGVIRMSAMPEVRSGSVGPQGPFRAMHPYYAIVDPNEPHLLRLEVSIGEGQKFGAGISMTQFYGIGPWRVHHAYEVGELVTLADPAGGTRCFYAQKSWWDPEFVADRDVLTQAIHTHSGSRIPGSNARTSAQQGAYWRELPGRSTGGAVPMTANEFTTGSTNLDLGSISGPHGLRTGQAVAIVDGTAPAGVSLDTRYWAIFVSESAIRLASSYANAIAATPILGPTAGAPRWGSLLVEGFVDFDANTVRWPSHGLSNGDTVVFGESQYVTHQPQAGIVLGDVYYVREATTDTFRISASAAGPLIDLPSPAGRFITAVGDSVYEVPHDYSEAELPRIGVTQSGDVMTMASQDHPVAELRRLTQSKWQLTETEFRAAVEPPETVYGTVVPGEGFKVTATGGPSAGRYYLITGNVDHAFTQGSPVYVSGVPGLTDGYYIAGDPSGIGTSKRNVFLQRVENGDDVVLAVNTGLDGRIRYAEDVAGERDQVYVVTAIDQNNEESQASEELTLSNGLFVSGASNTVRWSSSHGAKRYRVYKQLGGLFGLIGETDALEFKDDNIGPDLGVSPPIPDTSLRRHSVVTFDTVADAVEWAGHELAARTPVVFRTSDQMPGVNEGQTYYVLNPGEDDFQLAADPDSTDAVNLTGTDTGRHHAIAGDFPATASHFEGRRVFGGSRSKPQDIWMTAAGTEADLTYSIPTVDSDRIYFRIASRDISSIRHLIPLSQLVLLSDSTEYRLTPVNDDALTPSSVSVRPQSFVGAGYPAPALVNNTTVFAAARGGHMRALAYSRDVLGYLTGDLSIRAAHLFDRYTIARIAYAKAPIPIVWCVSSSGKLLGLTYIPEESIVAWHQHTTGASGVFESVAVVPEGDEDAVYVVVRRTINGVERRFVERLANEFDGATLPDAFYVDCGLGYSGAATTTITGLDHLEGETVSYLADGLPGTGTITGGTLTLAAAASVVQVGIGITARIQTLPLSMLQVDAFGTGRQKNVNQVWVRVYQSSAFDSGPTIADLRPSRTPAAGLLADDLVSVQLPGAWDDDGQVVVQQSNPLPLTVSGLTIEVASGG